MNIQYLRYNQIDKKKWDKVIAADERGLPYAFSWYLDASTGGQWDALVVEDYKMVCPLPWNRKLLGFKQIYTPLLSQQLGVYGDKVTIDDIEKILEKIPASFRQVVYALNQDLSSGRDKKIKGAFNQKINLILNLESDHATLQANYGKSLRQRIRKAKKLNHIETSTDIDLLMNFYKKNLGSRFNFSDDKWANVSAILKSIQANLNSTILLAKNESGDITGMAFFVQTPQRIINLFAGSSDLGRSTFAMHLLLDAMIEKYAGQKIIFDFEGSSIPGIYDFFKSFGSQEENFSVYTYEDLPLAIKKIQDFRKK